MKEIKLGEVLEVTHGFAFKSFNYIEESNVVLVTLANFSESNNFKFNIKKATFYGADYPKEYNLKEGDLVVPLTEQVIGLFGNTAFIPKIDNLQFVLNQRVGKVKVKDNIDLRYIHFLLSTKTVRDQLEARASAGTKQRNISPKDIYDVKVLIHGYKDQQKIGESLYSIEKIINNNDSINEILSEIISDLYNRWFIQFDYPNIDNLPYKKYGGEMIFNEKIKRYIPRGWKVQNLFKNDLCSVIKTGVDYFDKKNYLATSNVNESEITDGNWIEFETRENRANMQPDKNTVWFAKMKNSIKHITITEYDDWFIDKYILSTGFFGLQCTKSSLSYVHSYINSDIFEFTKDRYSHGATQEAVNNNDLKYINILVPPKDILNKFNDIIYPMLKIINSNKEVNQNLMELQNFIIPLIMNGQVKLN